MKEEKLVIEFFHDIICSFCFPMSYNMRRLVEEVDNIEVRHKSFALMPTENLFEMAYGSREAAKDEILSHWEHANEIDEEHRFNVEGMREETFPFPSSMPPLRAAKAAGLVGGEAMYWDMFDALQEGLFVKSLNIQDEEVIFDIARGVEGLDFDKWRDNFENDAINEVIKDLELNEKYQITSAPTLIIGGKYSIGGAVPFDALKDTIIKIKEEEGIR